MDVGCADARTGVVMGVVDADGGADTGVRAADSAWGVDDCGTKGVVKGTAGGVLLFLFRLSSTRLRFLGNDFAELGRAFGTGANHLVG